MQKIEKSHFGWIRLLSKVVILIIALHLIFNCVFGLHRAEGGSMSGRIEDGDLLLFVRNNEQFSADEVILFEHNGSLYISEIIATPGDLIEADEYGRFYVNNTITTDGIMYDAELGEKTNISLPYRVPNDSYFVINHNLEYLDDSRNFGAIPKQSIKGKIIGILRTRSV